MNKVSGIDLHSNSSVVMVSDQADRVVYQRRLPNAPAQIRGAPAPHREDLAMVIEATYAVLYPRLALGGLSGEHVST
jgi:transposase